MPNHFNLLVYYDGSPESRSALLRVTRLGFALAATVLGRPPRKPDTR
jgi:hypothetical protein